MSIIRFICLYFLGLCKRGWSIIMSQLNEVCMIKVVVTSFFTNSGFDWNINRNFKRLSNVHTCKSIIHILRMIDQDNYEHNVLYNVLTKLFLMPDYGNLLKVSIVLVSCFLLSCTSIIHFPCIYLTLSLPNQ